MYVILTMDVKAIIYKKSYLHHGSKKRKAQIACLYHIQTCDLRHSLLLLPIDS